MSKEDIIQECCEYVSKAVEELDDQDYMDALYEISGNLSTSADAKAEELEQ